MTGLHEAVADYLTIRRALGFKLVEHQRPLNDFATFLKQAGASTITTELAVAWAIRSNGTESWKAARLSVIRGFAGYMRTIDPATEIPPTRILIARKQYAIPFVYSQQEIGRLLAEATALTPPLRAATYYTLLGLLAVSGMRIGEALRLDRDDVDLDAGVLTIRLTKFNKSRQLPVHPSTTAALTRYDRQRDELCPRPTAPSFFVSTRSNRLDKSGAQHVFRVLRRRAGIERPRGSPQPRLHDIRHAFAVQTLLDWHRSGVDVQARMLWLSTYLGHVEPSDTYRYLTAAPELLALAAERLQRPAMTLLAPTLEAFFCERLMSQRQASPHTIAGYRDTMRLLLCFATEQTGKQPSKLEISDLDVRLISAFLNHLEHERHNTASTRNVRLAAIRSLFRFAALRHPEHSDVIARVLAIPAKRFERALISFLTKDEVNALLAAPDRGTWTGRRDHALLRAAIQTGLRVSELTGLRCQDVHLGTISYLFTLGKNRKQRTVPLTSQTVKVLTAWLKERQGQPEEPLFPSNRHGRLSRDAVEWLIAKHTKTAAERCPTLHTRTSPPTSCDTQPR